MILTLLQVLIFLAAISLLYWGFSKLTLPEPFKTILLVIIGLILLAFMWNWVAVGHLLTLR